ncbi:MAG: penicillin-binding protein 2, partial [Cyanobacteriota bacterium SKYGB_h_bin112]|nr:penicillin-binding protein 2 [Cyanobacteriota bacterium SKYGB_h_bin112]
HGSRLILVWLVLLLSIIGLMIRLMVLQLIDSPELSQKAQQQHSVYVSPFLARRPITDRQGTILAIDQLVYQLYAHPRLFTRPRSEIATLLAPILDMPATELLRTFDRAETGILVKLDVPESSADRILKLGLEGIDLVKSRQRFYPQQELAADVVGYVSQDQDGQAGIEYSQQALLTQTSRPVEMQLTANGLLVPQQPSELPNGDHFRLQLTLDMRLQRSARNSLRKSLQQYGAKRGTVIVMDARDGSLLALASEPSYDPNRYYVADLDAFRNWAVTDLYEPGSTFKPLNVAIALETKAVLPNSRFYDVGRLYIDEWTIENYDYSEIGGRGWVTIPEILIHSSNVGMVRIMQQLKPSVYYAWLQKLNLGNKSGVDLPFEVPSQLKSRTQFVQAAVEPATASFGQGFSLTPVQLMQAISPLVNDGKLVTPHVLKGMVDAEGHIYWRPDLPAPRQVFSPRTSRTVLAMMEEVVTSGTGRTAAIPGYRIAGKTGTSQKAKASGGYYKQASIASFFGVLTVNNPRYVVLAVVDEPLGERAFGSTVAAPIVKEVMEQLILIEGIPPEQQSSR